MDRACEEERRRRPDGIFLSCTSTTQIEAIADIERLVGKPLVNSNQAVLWGCVKKLQGMLFAARADAAAWAADAAFELAPSAGGLGLKA